MFDGSIFFILWDYATKIKISQRAGKFGTLSYNKRRRSGGGQEKEGFLPQTFIGIRGRPSCQEAVWKAGLIKPSLSRRETANIEPPEDLVLIIEHFTICRSCAKLIPFIAEICLGSLKRCFHRSFGYQSAKGCVHVSSELKEEANVGQR